VLAASTPLHAQNTAYVIEAESGVLGSNMVTSSEGDVSWVEISTSAAGTAPGSADNVVTLTPSFSQAGEYDLYARLYVGPETYSDDSFFYANAFGSPAVDDEAQWVTMNQIAAAMGYTEDDQLIADGGQATTEAWKWVRLQTEEAALTYTVPDNVLTQTFQFAGREDGLRIDKFAFGPHGYSFTVNQIENGLPGTEGVPEEYQPEGPPIASAKSKFLGSAYADSQAKNFTYYWNQVVPENAGKWGSVEGTRDTMNWADLDEAYNLAQENGFPFRMHVLVWGPQQPGWISSLDPSDQLAELQEWFDAVAERYPDLDYLEVVNEPLHAAPDGTSDRADYIDALGGIGDSGHDWILTAFRMARDTFPASVKLMINEYGVVGSNSNTTAYLDIIGDLQAENLIDVIGIQCHAFETRGSVDTMQANLDRLAESGLPIMVTEMDIDGTTGDDSDTVQLADYQRVFPVFWEHPDVIGITLWGWRIGLWRTDEEAFLVDEYGYERPALQWLREYVQSSEDWYGYDVWNNWVQTDDWLGKIYVGYAPWIWAGDNWIWMPNPDESETGAWGYISK